MNKNVKQIDFDNGNNNKLKVKAFWISAIYVKESELGHLLRFYYLIS